MRNYNAQPRAKFLLCVLPRGYFACRSGRKLSPNTDSGCSVMQVQVQYCNARPTTYPTAYNITLILK